MGDPQVRKEVGKDRKSRGPRKRKRVKGKKLITLKGFEPSINLLIRSQTPLGIRVQQVIFVNTEQGSY